MFDWSSAHVSAYLPPDWVDIVLDVARRHVRVQACLFRTVDDHGRIENRFLPVERVDGGTVAVELPWLEPLYRGPFLRLACRATRHRVEPMDRFEQAAGISVQTGTGHSPVAHVDTVPLEGLLAVTTHPRGGGGEIVFSNRDTMVPARDVEFDCSRLHPVSGRLDFFDASRTTHFVRPLVGRPDSSVRRVMIVLGYLTTPRHAPDIGGGELGKDDSGYPPP